MSRNARHHLDPANRPDTADFTPRALSKQEFGRRLYALMMERRWTQSELARAAKLGRDAVSTYIRGRSFPEPKNLQKLADALGVKREDLLPNTAMRAMENDVAPMLEIRQAQGHPDKVWLRVNQMVTLDQAAQIFQVLRAVMNA